MRSRRATRATVELSSLGGVSVVSSGVRVVESAMEPPSSIPNLVVPHGSAGKYCVGNCVGG